MSDPLRDVRTGEDLEMLLRADNFNLKNEAARAHRDNKLGKTGSSGNPRKANPFNTAWFRFDENSLGLPPFSIVKIGELKGSTSADLKLTTLSEPIFLAETPATADDNFAILETGIPSGDASLGLGAVAGVVLCKVNVTDAGHTRAKPTPGETAYLTSAAAGGVPVLWKESGTGELWAVVRIDEGTGGDASGFWAEITGSSGTPLGYSWKRKVMTGPGVWADATEPTPLTGTSDAYRAPSNIAVPAIPTGQVVELRPSLTSPGEYEIHAVGGIQTETFNIWRYTCSGGSLIETEYTVTVKGRDLDVSVA